jgi:hypothetical protein
MKKLARDKHSSLLCPDVGEVEKKFYKTDARFCGFLTHEFILAGR